MKPRLSALAILILALSLASGALAQDDRFGTADTLYADISRIDSANWAVTVSYTNDEPIIGLTVPLKMSAGLNRIVADSAVYTGGRVEHFSFKGFRPDTAVQCVLLGMVANLGPTDKRLEPGRGRLATIFVSSIQGNRIDSLYVDTATVSPSRQTLLTVRHDIMGEPPDTMRLSSADTRIVPVFVARYSR